MAQQITALPTPPSRTSPGTFSERTDAFLGALPGFVTEANAVAVEVETHGTAAVASAASAAADAQTATEQATLAVNATALLEPGYISDAAYDEAAWALITNAAASKKAVRDIIEAILTLVGNKQASDATLTALAELSTAADKLAYFTGNDTAAVTTLTAFARTLLDDVDAATMRQTLGLVLGTNVQAYSAILAALAGQSLSADTLVYATGINTFSTTALTAFARSLLDDADAATALATLGAQPASTAITTSNIASQSVSYATNANIADTVDGYHAAALAKANNLFTATQVFDTYYDQMTYISIALTANWGAGFYAFYIYDYPGGPFRERFVYEAIVQSTYSTYGSGYYKVYKLSKS